MDGWMVPAQGWMLRGALSFGSYMVLSMFKFLFMELSRWTLAPSFSLVCLGAWGGHREGEQ